MGMLENHKRCDLCVRQLPQCKSRQMQSRLWHAQSTSRRERVQEYRAACFEDIINSDTSVHICSLRNKIKPSEHDNCRYRKTPFDSGFGKSEKSIQILTWQVREEQDALVEAISQKTIPELLQYGHADTEGERGVTQQQRVPQVEDLVEWKHIYRVQKQTQQRGDLLNT